MLSLVIDLLVLVKSLGRGFKDDREFRAIAVLIMLLLAGGTMFYQQMEGWSIVDALYFCVMTIATIGNGHLVPSGEPSKLFTICFAILGIGLFASFVGKLVAIRVKSYALVKERLHHSHSG
jgi:voltage-gated potassium channel